MPSEICSMVGSGQQQFRQDSVGKNHNPGVAVFVTNWEDAIAVGPIRTSGYVVVSNPTRLPSGIQNLSGRRVIALYNNGPNAAFIGPTGVTINNGYPLGTGVEKAIALAANYDIYAVTSGAQTADIRVMEIA